jgi:transposase InsO family protein
VSLQGDPVGTGYRKGNLFYLPSAEVHNHSASIPTQSSSDLLLLGYHSRLSHVGLRPLKKLLSSLKIRPSFMNEVNIQKCPVCDQSKMHRRAFKSQSCHTADKPGRLIHSNVGLYEEVSREGYKYYVTFVNDHSKFVSVFPMKSKSPVFNCFKLFCASFEKDKCFVIMSLRSDNGGEYTSNEFTKYILSEEGIAHEPGPPHSPELNGVAKQMNRTISNLVRCSLLTAKLPKNFWADALRHLMFTLNSIPCHTPAGFLSPNSILGLPAVDDLSPPLWVSCVAQGSRS